MSLWVKICGITNAEDARVALDAGADAIGVNLIASSRRAVDIATARRLREAIGKRAEVVAVVADLDARELEELRDRTGIRSLQLHGSESPEELARLGSDAYKAVRVAEASDVDAARDYGGSRLLVDAKVPGELGGTGQSFDWSLVTELAKARSLVLAGGLTPDTVAEAVRFVQPYGVDTASGVEGADPRRKDPEKVARFVRAARGAVFALSALALTALSGCSGKPARELIAPDAPLPGEVAGMFQAKECSDGSGGPLSPGPRLFVALAPPGLVGDRQKLEARSYPAGVITLLDQRVGYDGVLLSRGTREARWLVYRTDLDARDGRALVEEIRLPSDFVDEGSLELKDAHPELASRGADAPPPLVMRCKLVTITPGLDTAVHVDYERDREARRAVSSPGKGP
jgi:phosphoribosylanthranilate isomerase